MLDMVAGNVDDLGAVARFAQQLLDDVIMFLRPVETFFQCPAVNDIANEVKLFTSCMFEEVKKRFGLCPWRSQMRI